MRDALVVLRRQPKLLETLAVLASEGASIAHHSSGHQGVTGQKIILFGEATDLARLGLFWGPSDSRLDGNIRV